MPVLPENYEIQRVHERDFPLCRRVREPRHHADQKRIERAPNWINQ